MKYITDDPLGLYCKNRHRFPSQEAKLRHIFLESGGLFLKVPESSILKTLRKNAKRSAAAALFLYLFFRYVVFLIIWVFGAIHLLFGRFESFAELAMLALSYSVVLWYLFVRTGAYFKKNYEAARHLAVALSEAGDRAIVETLRSHIPHREDYQRACARGATIYESARILGCGHKGAHNE